MEQLSSLYSTEVVRRRRAITAAPYHRSRRMTAVLGMLSLLAMDSTTSVKAESVVKTTSSSSVTEEATSTSSSTSEASTRFILQESVESDGSITLTITTSDNEETTISTFQTLTASASLHVNMWANPLTDLNNAIQNKDFVVVDNTVPIDVRFVEETEATALSFELNTAWKYDPELVFSNDSLAGLTSLQTLNFKDFQVSFDEEGWLSDDAELNQMVMDSCGINNFKVATDASISEVVIRTSNLTSFPTALLYLDEPLNTLKLESNSLDEPVKLTSNELELLQAIPSVSFSNNNILSTATCSNQTTYKSLRICVIGSGAVATTNPVLDPGSDIPTDSSTPVTSNSTSSSSSSKLLIAGLVVGGLCVIAVLIAMLVFSRHKKRAADYLGDEEVDLANQEVLLSPEKSDVAVMGDSAILVDLDLGKEQVKLEKKLGVHGIWRAEYQNEKVAALRLNPKALDLSFKELNAMLMTYVPLRHINIVQFIGSSTTALDDVLIVVEFMEKGTLRQVVTDVNIELSWQQRLQMGIEIASGLDFLHSTSDSMVSQNLTSRSVLCNAQLTCKLDIFDYAAKIRKEVPPVLDYGHGDISTRAPELLTGSSPITRAAEVYAFGVILCEISRRQVAFSEILADRGPTLGDIFIAKEVIAQRLRPTAAADAPEEFHNLVARCLAYDPAMRPEMLDILKALTSFRD